MYYKIFVAELLQIAAQKQHEPIVIEEKPQEEEKLYTKKQKRELEKEKEWREHRERRQKEMEAGDSNILERQLTKPLTATKPPISPCKASASLPKRPEEKSSSKVANSALKSSHSNGAKTPLKSPKPSGALTKDGIKRENSASSKGKIKEASRDFVQKVRFSVVCSLFPKYEFFTRESPRSFHRGI